MKFTKTKKSFLMIAGCTLIAASQANAAITMQMDIIGSGLNASVVYDTVLGGLDCIDNVAGSCDGLTFSQPGDTGAYGSLFVGGEFGQFTVALSALGGLAVISPTLQDLTEQNVSTSGAGTLFTRFTSTDFCLGGGECFGDTFRFAVTNNPASGGAANSITTFVASMDDLNGIPAGNTIGAFVVPGFGLATDAFNNPGGASGSLSTITEIQFSGAGSVQTTATISAPIPEPATISLIGLGLAFGAFKLRRKVGKG
jgi:hypothetical protein